MKNNSRLAVLALMILALLAVNALGFADAPAVSVEIEPLVTEEPALEPEPVPVAADERPATGYAQVYSADNPIPAIAERCLPSVVGIINLVTSYDYTTKETADVEMGSASGVVIDNDGHIMTNAHVVEGADKIQVLLEDETTLEAEIVGSDADTDVAIIHVDGLDLPPIAIGDSSALSVGDLVIAIGNPGGYYGTVTAGIVSALERDLEEFNRPIDIIQTDAAMNPGISGGALLNAQGELIGIPTLGVIEYEGLNFAVPSNTALDVAEQLIQYGKVRKPSVGIIYTVQDGPDEPLRNYPPAGLLVMEVKPNTPAEFADMRVGDIITEADGVRVTNGRELTIALMDKEAGDTVLFRVYRATFEDRDVNLNFVDIEVTLEYID